MSRLGKLLGVFLILPAIAMGFYAVMIANNEIDIEDVSSVSISDERYKHIYSGKDDIGKYVNLILEAKNGAVQEIVDDAKLYKIEFEMKNGATKSYSFYPSLRGENLLKDGTGHIRRVEEIDELLCRQEFESLYEVRYLPEVSVEAAGEKQLIKPLEYQWNYQKTDGNLYSYSKAETASELPVFTMSEDGLKKKFINFSINPDVFLTEYSYGGKSYIKIESLSLEDGEKITVSAYAKWNQRENSVFFGEGKWSFECVFHKSPIITLEKTEASLGECFVVYIENSKGGEMLSVESEIITYKTPMVYNGEKSNFALIPVDLKTRCGEHNIKISLGDSSFDFKVNVSSVSNGFAMKNVGADIYNTVNSPSGIAENEKFVSSLISKGETHFLWESPSMLKPVNAEIDTGFGWEVLYNGAPPQVLLEGNSYEVAEKTSVKSSAKGCVIFSGETSKTGKAVVIDHGCGIMSHYYHLSVLSATVGEEIEADKLIALSGKTGYTDKADLFFAVSINGVFVNPDLFK